MQPIKLSQIMKSEPCPCGSGKKYKACCLSKKDKPTPDLLYTNENYLNHYALKQLKDNNIKECLHPNQAECKGIIKAAHAVQNGRILELLAIDGHVIVVKPGVDFNGIKTSMDGESRNKATTFTGFCDYHDSNVFRDIEAYDYDKNSEKQNFLFAYRAFSLELHKKKIAFAVFQDMIKDKPSFLKTEPYVLQYRNHQLSFKDLYFYKNVFDKSLIDEDYSSIYTRVFEFNMVCGFALCSGFALAYDLSGNELNDLQSFDEEPFKFCFLTVFPFDQKSYVLFSWLKQDQSYFEEYENQLISLGMDGLRKYLNNLIPAYTENLVLSPKLWDSFTGFKKRTLANLISSEFRQDADFELPHSKNKNLLNDTVYDLFTPI